MDIYIDSHCPYRAIWVNHLPVNFMLKFHLLDTYIHQLYVDAMLMFGIGNHTTVHSLVDACCWFCWGIYL